MQSTQADYTMMEQMVDFIRQPTVLIDVRGVRAFTFRRFNIQFEQETGLPATQFANQTPEEALPYRMADTLIENYEHCRRSKTRHSYFENLDLPNGHRWLHTTLSPVLDEKGEVAMIISISVDITDEKMRGFQWANQMSENIEINQRVRRFSSLHVQGMSTPIQSMVEILDALPDGFTDLGNGKLQQIDTCRQTAKQALSRLNELVGYSEKIAIETYAHRRIDFGHLCRDLAAIFDKAKLLAITFPCLTLQAELTALELILREAIKDAVRYADHRVEILVEQFSDDMICISVLDDGLGALRHHPTDGNHGPKPSVSAQPDAPPDGPIVNIRRLLAGQGGRMTMAESRNGLQGSKFIMPGQIISENDLIAAQ